MQSDREQNGKPGPVLVTGATGLVGNNVVRQLLDQGVAVRVLARASSASRPLAGLDLELRQGDVRDAEVVERAVAGAAAVIHAAAFVHIGWTNAEQMQAINVEGTRHVAEAARRAGIRLVHVSTADTIGLLPNRVPADENVPFGGKTDCPYVRTKALAESVVLEQIAGGLDAVITNPGFMFGPWDWKPSSGRMFLEVVKRFTPVAPVGGCSLCDARDVAAGILAAWRTAPTGRRYLLAGHNISYYRLWRTIARLTGCGGPWIPAGPLMRIIAGRYGDLWTAVTGEEAVTNSASVAMSNLRHYYRSDRAIAELGYSPRPVEETILDTWHWFQEHGYLKK